MLGKVLSLVVFFVGVFLSHAYLMLKFVWDLLGLPGDYPLMWEGANSYVAGMMIAFSPLVGGLLMIVGGLINGREANEEASA